VRAAGLAALALAAAAWGAPSITRMSPLGGMRGTTVRIELSGAELSNVVGAEFDTPEILWKSTRSASHKRVEGEIAIGATAGLGPHLMKLRTLDGHSETVLLYVGQFPAVPDTEPNDTRARAQTIPAIPAEIYGEIAAVEDSDYYAVDVQAGETLNFELRAYEYGSQLEAKLHLYDSSGRRVAFNDDYSDFDDNPALTYRFPAPGRYFAHVDLYRGPRAYGARVNNSYVLRISRLPVLHHVSRLGAAPGAPVRFTIAGGGLEAAAEVMLTQARRAEYFRMTYPTTVPIAAEIARPEVVRGEVVRRQAGQLEVEFRLPAGIPPGLWRLAVAGPAGVAEGGLFEVAPTAEWSEAAEIDARRAGEIAVNGALAGPREKDTYRVRVKARQPLHIWTLSAQLGQPELDTVLELRSPEGKLLQESDDAVTGIASLGNADSSLFYTPPADDVLLLTIRDRQNRGGPAFAYRLRLRPEIPRFQLWTLPDNLTIPRGGAADLTVQMAREPGFENEEVSVWVEGVPGLAEAPRARFRADQAWEPGADLLQQITPEVTIPLRIPAGIAPGQYTIRVLGVAKREEHLPGRRIVEAHANLKRGPLNGLFNYTRRPLAAVTLSVVEPVTAEVKTELTGMEAVPGAAVRLKVTLANVPAGAAVELRGLPEAVTWRKVESTPESVEFEMEAPPALAGRSFAFTAEANVNGRWTPSREMQLKIAVGPAAATAESRGPR
jgi:hypothetical protein